MCIPLIVTFYFIFFFFLFCEYIHRRSATGCRPFLHEVNLRPLWQRIKISQMFGTFLCWGIFVYIPIHVYSLLVTTYVRVARLGSGRHRTRPIPVFVNIGLDCLEAAIIWADIKTNRLWWWWWNEKAALGYCMIPVCIRTHYKLNKLTVQTLRLRSLISMASSMYGDPVLCTIHVLYNMYILYCVWYLYKKRVTCGVKSCESVCL